MSSKGPLLWQNSQPSLLSHMLIVGKVVLVADFRCSDIFIKDFKSA